MQSSARYIYIDTDHFQKQWENRLNERGYKLYKALSVQKQFE